MSPRAMHASALASALDAGHDSAVGVTAVVDAARRSLAASGAQLSLMTDRQITAAVSAPDLPHLCRGSETAFDDTMCATTLRTGVTMQVDDAATDSRVSSIPAVRSGLVTSYLGVPVRTGDLLVGVLCVFGVNPRSWTEGDRACLAELALQVGDELSRLPLGDQHAADQHATDQHLKG